jgi:hypothetical protein
VSVWLTIALPLAEGKVVLTGADLPGIESGVAAEAVPMMPRTASRSTMGGRRRRRIHLCYRPSLLVLYLASLDRGNQQG